MNCHQLQLLLGLCCSFWLGARGAQVYMEFNGQKYAYNTDEAVQRNDPIQAVRKRTQWGWVPPPPVGPAQRRQVPQIDVRTENMSHIQHTDDSGIVLGKYSYYDAAGYHELSYKAGAGIGFVVMGGNLAKPTEQADSLHSYRSVS